MPCDGVLCDGVHETPVHRGGARDARVALAGAGAGSGRADAPWSTERLTASSELACFKLSILEVPPGVLDWFCATTSLFEVCRSDDGLASQSGWACDRDAVLPHRAFALKIGDEAQHSAPREKRRATTGGFQGKNAAHEAGTSRCTPRHTPDGAGSRSSRIPHCDMGSWRHCAWPHRPPV